jgi:PIN domain nuclease of toxin-antitoxin system
VSGRARTAAADRSRRSAARAPPRGGSSAGSHRPLLDPSSRDQSTWSHADHQGVGVQGALPRDPRRGRAHGRAGRDLEARTARRRGDPSAAVAASEIPAGCAPGNRPNARRRRRTGDSGVSDISLWEIATLLSLGRIAISLPLRDWLEAAAAPPLVQRRPISPAIASEVASLPDTFHRDPADRIIVATARVHDATLLTRDRRIVDAGLVPTVR